MAATLTGLSYLEYYSSADVQILTAVYIPNIACDSCSLVFFFS